MEINACVRAPALSILYENHGARAMRKENSTITQFPLVELGCSALADSRGSLLQHLSALFEQGTLGQRVAQEKNFRIDGGNASRAAKMILKTVD